jgi:serine O-acetyltransferase
MGGFWKLKEKINVIPSGAYRGLLMNIYYLYLRNQGSFIGHTAAFDGLPLFPHGMKGVFIAGGSKIGKNCIIFHHVTLGANPLPYSKTTGFPTIGDNCYIGAGGTVIGAIKIGNNCRIGANCTVSADVPDNCVVVSQAPRIIKHNNMLNRYYKWSHSGPVYYCDGRWLIEKDTEIVERLRNKI